MAGTQPSSQPGIEELLRLVGELQNRVLSLEKRVEGQAAFPDAAPLTPLAPARVSEPGAFEETASLAPLLGKALLGLSAAYLLRALSEFQVLPLTAGMAVGMVYALWWLLLAARTAATERASAVVYALTSVLILVPLLWETSVRFHAVSPWIAAGVVLLFSVFGLAISWRKDLTVIAWITTLAGLLAASGLLLATRDLAPFTLALLALAAAVEYSACLEHWLRERWVVAMAADLSVLLLTFVFTRRGGLPEGYAAISMAGVIGIQIALLAIYLSSTIVRTLWRHFTFTTFEIVQCVLAFLISTIGALRTAQGNPAALMTVAVFCLICGASCYLVCFAFLEREGQRDRNFYTYATFGLLLVLTGSRLLLRDPVLLLLWSLLALVFLRMGRKAGRMMLKWHGAAYLVLASLASGVAGQAAARFLTGSGHTNASALTAGGVTTILASLLAYALFAGTPPLEGTGWNYRLLSVVLAVNAGWGLAGAAAELALPQCPGGGATDYCPTVLMAILILLAIGSGVLNRLRPRFELRWCFYLFLAIATAKLGMQDLRQSHALAIVISLILYGGTLVLLPRVLKAGR
jgi:hypothetical protein